MGGDLGTGEAPWVEQVGHLDPMLEMSNPDGYSLVIHMDMLPSYVA